MKVIQFVVHLVGGRDHYQMHGIAHLNGDVHRIEIGLYFGTGRKAAAGFHINSYLAKSYQWCQKEQGKQCFHRIFL